jgi:hypothetical protein
MGTSNEDDIAGSPAEESESRQTKRRRLSDSPAWKSKPRKRLERDSAGRSQKKAVENGSSAPFSPQKVDQDVGAVISRKRKARRLKVGGK